MMKHAARAGESGKAAPRDATRLRKWTIGRSDQKRPPVKRSRRNSRSCSSSGSALATSWSMPSAQLCTQIGVPAATARTRERPSIAARAGGLAPSSTSRCPRSARSSSPERDNSTANDDPDEPPPPGSFNSRQGTRSTSGLRAPGNTITASAACMPAPRGPANADRIGLLERLQQLAVAQHRGAREDRDGWSRSGAAPLGFFVIS